MKTAEPSKCSFIHIRKLDQQSSSEMISSIYPKNTEFSLESSISSSDEHFNGARYG